MFAADVPVNVSIQPWAKFGWPQSGPGRRAEARNDSKSRNCPPARGKGCCRGAGSTLSTPRHWTSRSTTSPTVWRGWLDGTGRHAASMHSRSRSTACWCCISSARRNRARAPDALMMTLLHDAPEYVIGDMISPFKAVIGGDYRMVEERLLAAIHLRFGLAAITPAPWRTSIKRADAIAAWFEATRLAGFTKAEADKFFPHAEWLRTQPGADRTDVSGMRRPAFLTHSCNSNASDRRRGRTRQDAPQGSLPDHGQIDQAVQSVEVVLNAAIVAVIGANPCILRVPGTDPSSPTPCRGGRSTRASTAPWKSACAAGWRSRPA